MTDKILLASYTCKLWPIARQDRRINANITKKLGLGSNAVAAKKFRINPKRDEWLRITRNRDAFRAFHYAVTIPYKHGYALLNPLAFDEYQERFDAAKQEHDAAVAAFLANLDSMKAEVRDWLTDSESGDCYYRESDYADLTAEAFGFGMQIEPLVHDATFDKFADIIGGEKAQELADALAAENDRAFKASCDNVAQRVSQALTRASDRLHNSERWNDSAIKALQELTDLLPVLNIGDDPHIENTRKELAALFRSYSTQSVADKGNRKSCASEVDRILSKFGNRTP